MTPVRNCFLQAEDGIRDGHVTGVQTCALPICRHQRLLAALVALQDRRVKLPVARLWDPQVQGAYPCIELPGLIPITGGPALEIGRASCRERGESWGRGGEVTQK